MLAIGRRSFEKFGGVLKKRIMDGQTDTRIDRQMDEGMDRQVDGWTDG